MFNLILTYEILGITQNIQNQSQDEEIGIFTYKTPTLTMT